MAYTGSLDAEQEVDGQTPGSPRSPSMGHRSVSTEPFAVMTSRWTSLMGVFGLALGFGLLIWAWTSELPLWWKGLMSPFGVMFFAVGLQYVLSGRYPTIVLDQVGITYRPYEDVVPLLRRGPVVRLRWDEISSVGYERSDAGRWLVHPYLPGRSGISTGARRRDEVASRAAHVPRGPMIARPRSGPA